MFFTCLADLKQWADRFCRILKSNKTKHTLRQNRNNTSIDKMSLTLTSHGSNLLKGERNSPVSGRFSINSRIGFKNSTYDQIDLHNYAGVSNRSHYKPDSLSYQSPVRFNQTNQLVMLGKESEGEVVEDNYISTLRHDRLANTQ